MKLNGKNFINSSDITLDGDASVLGNTLDTVLVSLQEDILKLKSNVKWLYKYGGVGSGSGTGTGSVDISGWSISALFNEQEIEDEMYLSGKGKYHLYVTISKPGGGTYNLTVRLGGNKIVTKSLNQEDNAWVYETNLDVQTNSLLSIEVLDMDNEVKRINSSLIVESYLISDYIINTAGIQQNINEPLFIENVNETGLWVKVSHSIVAPFDHFYITVTFNNKLLTKQVTSTYGDTLFNLLDLIPGLSNDDSNNYQCTIDYDLKLTKSFNSENIELSIKSIDLIPTSFYLLSKCNTGTIYNSTQENPFKFQTGIVNLYLTAYNGITLYVRDYNIDINVNFHGETNSTTTYHLTLRERTSTSFSLNCPSEGMYEIELICNLYNFSKIIYLYTHDKYSNLDYFTNTTVYERYKFIGNPGTDEINLTNEAIYKVTGTSSDYTVNSKKGTLEYGGVSSIFNTLLNIGIKYSKINSEDNPIATITTNANQKIIIYPTYIDFFGTTFSISIKLVSNYTSIEDENFLLITICCNNVRNSSVGQYQYTVYFNGILEAGQQSFSNSPLNISNVVLHPSNYQIDVLDVSYIEPCTQSKIDTVVDNYTSVYRIKKLKEEDYSREMLEVLTDNPPEVTNDGIIFNSTAVSNLSSKGKIPTIVFKVPYSSQEMYSGTENVGLNLENMLKNLGNAGSSSALSKLKYKINLCYAPAGENVLSENYNMSKALIDYYFYIIFQGTSTMTYRSKNWFLGIANVSDSEIGTIFPIFTPNYNSEDVESFLPETGFTLKADVVDSSHSTNNACGQFINKEIPRIYSDLSYKYNDKVKNCLEGFPVLIFINFLTEQGADSQDFYYLGIYNFNLGRDSYFNLGYADLNKALNGQELSNGFKVYTAQGANNSPILFDNLWVTEIQDNNLGFDFSLYDSTVLFNSSDTNLKDSAAMLDDFVSPLSADVMLNLIQTFIHKVVDAGAYVFNSLYKNFGLPEDFYGAEDDNGIPLNQVPDYKLQYKRDGSNLINPYSYNVYGSTQTTPGLNALESLIFTDEQTGTPPLLDYYSTLYYFVACMGLGLVDSVLKNLNLKNWSLPNQVKPAFYDMDTALGIDNAGEQGISKYAFSDYWTPNNDEEILKNCLVYRDYKPKYGFSGYDIPSSYLFAIVKYASSLTNKSLSLDPQSLWYTWRNEASQTDGTYRKGPFYTADTFIDEYFSNRTKNIEPILKNLNYRYKYFVMNNSDDLFDTTNFKKFNGTRTEQVRNWLNTRFHLLDMMFNLHGGVLKVMKYENGLYSEVKTEQGDYVYYKNDISKSQNSDVLVCHEIFSSDGNGVQPAGGVNATITAPSYTPLVVTQGENIIGQYILENPETLYRLSLPSLGARTTIFGGSAMWQTLSNIDSFVSSAGTLYVNSDYLLNIISSTKAVNTLTLNTPAVKKIAINNEKSSATLTLKIDESTTTDSYPNLEEIDISNTKMSLDIKGESVKKININNINANNISIVNCDLLVTLNKDNITANTFTLSCGNNKNIGKSMSFESTHITNMTLSTTCEGAALIIRNDYSLTTLNASGFSSIIISGCSNLLSITVSNDIKLLSITYCNSSNDIDLTDFTIDNFENNLNLFTFAINSTSKGVIDLSNTLINLLNLSATKGFYKVITDNNSIVNLESECFYHTYLRYLQGGLFVIQGIKTFQDTPFYDLKTSSGSYTNLSIGENVTSLEATFKTYYIKNYTEYTPALVQKFLNLIPSNNKITSIKEIFRGRNITLTESDILYAYLLKTSQIILKNLSNCTDASYAFFNNNIEGYNRYMFDDTFGSVSGVNIDNLLGILDINTRQITAGITLDFLANIADRVQSFGNGIVSMYDSNSDILKGYSFNSVYKIWNESETVSLKNIFNYSFPKLTTINGFTILDNLNTIDFDGLFDNVTNILYIYSFMSLSNSCTNVINFDGLFYNLKNIKAFNNRCLNILTITVDWYNLFDWKTLFTNYKSSSFGDVNVDNINNSYYTSLTIPKTISQEGYVNIWKYINTSNSITELNNFFYNCTFNDFSDLTIPNTCTKLKSLCGFYNYAKSNINDGYIKIDPELFKKLPNVYRIHYMFANIKWEGGIPFNFFKTRTLNITSVYDLNRNPIKYYRYSYTTNKFNICSLFENTIFETPYFEEDNYTIEKNCLKTEDGIELETTKYYESETSTKLLEVVTNPEYYDVTNIGETDEGVNNYDWKGSTTIIEHPRLFVSPDILYSIVSSNYLTKIFYNTNLQGLIPINLTNNCKSTYIANSFYKVNIYPRKIIVLREANETDDERAIYQFVPDNFTTRTDISLLFNFLIRIPAYSSGDDINNIYLVLGEKSVGNITSANGAFPEYWTKDNDDNYKTPTTCKYNIMGTIDDANNVTFGIPSSKCSNLDYQGIINSRLIRVLYGEVFPDVTFSTKKILGTTAVITIYYTVSPSFIFPGISNENMSTGSKIFIKLLESGNVSVSASLIRNESDLDKYKTYYRIVVK